MTRSYNEKSWLSVTAIIIYIYVVVVVVAIFTTAVVVGSCLSGSKCQKITWNIRTIITDLARQTFHSNLFIALDTDECTDGTHSCDANAVCNNTRGSYNCTCKDGFYGDGINCTGNYLHSKASNFIIHSAQISRLLKLCV